MTPTGRQAHARPEGRRRPPRREGLLCALPSPQQHAAVGGTRGPLRWEGCGSPPWAAGKRTAHVRPRTCGHVTPLLRPLGRLPHTLTRKADDDGAGRHGVCPGLFWPCHPYTQPASSGRQGGPGPEGPHLSIFFFLKPRDSRIRVITEETVSRGACHQPCVGSQSPRNTCHRSERTVGSGWHLRAGCSQPPSVCRTAHAATNGPAHVGLHSGASRTQPPGSRSVLHLSHLQGSHSPKDATASRPTGRKRHARL